MPLILLTMLIGGCQTPQSLERRLDELQPAALDAAKERAHTDLSCDESIATDVISRASGDPSAFSVDRSEYKIAASGCNRRIVLTVACTKHRMCSALAQDAVVRSIPKK
jgi:hypothetical protein